MSDRLWYGVMLPLAVEVRSEGHGVDQIVIRVARASCSGIRRRFVVTGASSRPTR